MMCIGARNGTLRKAILALVSFEYIFFFHFLPNSRALTKERGKVCAVSMHRGTSCVQSVQKSAHSGYVTCGHR